MNILEKITQDLAALTEEQITQARDNLDPAKEKEIFLGFVTSIHSQRLWALGFEYSR